MTHQHNLLKIIKDKDKTLVDFEEYANNLDYYDFTYNSDELLFESLLKNKLEISNYIMSKKQNCNFNFNINILVDEIIFLDLLNIFIFLIDYKENKGYFNDFDSYINKCLKVYSNNILKYLIENKKYINKFDIIFDIVQNKDLFELFIKDNQNIINNIELSNISNKKYEVISTIVDKYEIDYFKYLLENFYIKSNINKYDLIFNVFINLANNKKFNDSYINYLYDKLKLYNLVINQNDYNLLFRLACENSNETLINIILEKSEYNLVDFTNYYNYFNHIKYKNKFEFLLLDFSDKISEYFYDKIVDKLNLLSLYYNCILRRKICILKKINIDNYKFNDNMILTIKQNILYPVYKINNDNSIINSKNYNEYKRYNNNYELLYYLINKFDSIKDDNIFIIKNIEYELYLKNYTSICYYFQILGSNLKNKNKSLLKNIVIDYINNKAILSNDVGDCYMLEFIVKKLKEIKIHILLKSEINDLINSNENLSLKFLEWYLKDNKLNIERVINSYLNKLNLYKYNDEYIDIIIKSCDKEELINYLNNNIDYAKILTNSDYNNAIFNITHKLNINIDESFNNNKIKILNELNNENRFTFIKDIFSIYLDENLFVNIFYDETIVEFIKSLIKKEKDFDKLLTFLIKEDRNDNINYLIKMKNKINLKKYGNIFIKIILCKTDIELLNNILEKDYEDKEILQEFINKLVKKSINWKNITIFEYLFNKYNINIENNIPLLLTKWLDYNEDEKQYAKDINNRFYMIRKILKNCEQDKDKNINIFIEYIVKEFKNKVFEYIDEIKDLYDEYKYNIHNLVIQNYNLNFIKYYEDQIIYIDYSKIKLTNLLINFNEDKFEYISNKSNFNNNLSLSMLLSNVENNNDNEYKLLIAYLYKDKNNHKMLNDELFKCLCYHNYLESIDYLLSINDKIDINHNSDEAFKNACSSGSLEVIKYLLDKSKNINISDNNEQAMMLACSNGYLHVAKYLYEIKSDINLSTNNDAIFTICCNNGRLKVLKWLYDNIEHINYKVYHEYSICGACYYGHLNTAKWLYKTLNIDITVDNDYCFRNAVKNEFYDIVIWITKLRTDRYKVEFNDNFDELISFEINKELIIDDYKEIKEIIECPICYDNKSDIISCCNHQFCKSCIETVYKNSIELNCPYCRKENIELYNIEHII